MKNTIRFDVSPIATSFILLTLQPDFHDLKICIVYFDLIATTIRAFPGEHVFVIEHPEVIELAASVRERGTIEQKLSVINLFVVLINVFPEWQHIFCMNAIESSSQLQRSTLEAKLSANGMMRNTTITKAENDFSFVVGNNRCSCPWFIAAFLSPKIAKLHALDPLICEFHLETKDPKQEFEQFLSLGWDTSFIIDDDHLLFIHSIVRELSNCELSGLIDKKLERDLNISNVLERLRDSETFDFPSDKLIAFVASHFYQFNSSQVSNISLSTFSSILSHESLQIQDEDSLYDLLSQYFDKSSAYFSLVEHLHFDYLSQVCISHFNSFSSDHFELVNQFIITESSNIRSCCLNEERIAT
jgi:hypothetical protein